jgi:hypothetical protein
MVVEPRLLQANVLVQDGEQGLLDGIQQLLLQC